MSWSRSRVSCLVPGPLGDAGMALGQLVALRSRNRPSRRFVRCLADPPNAWMDRICQRVADRIRIARDTRLHPGWKADRQRSLDGEDNCPFPPPNDPYAPVGARQIGKKVPDTFSPVVEKAVMLRIRPGAQSLQDSSCESCNLNFACFLFCLPKVILCLLDHPTFCTAAKCQ